jgi:hypothetical protein
MIHEEICTYDVCKLAKENGFPQLGIDSNNYWFEDNNGDLIDMNVKAFVFDAIPKEGLTRKIPQSLLQRWLREEKGIHIDVVLDWQYNIEVEEIRYQYRIGSKRIMTTGGVQTRGIVCDRYFATYELALEDALKYALENLV